MFEGLATYGTRKFDDIMVNKNKKNKDFIIGLFVVIMFGYLATNAIMVYQNYKNYKSKIEIVATMISDTDESNMDTAIKVLKEKNLESPEQGYEILNKYGYLEYNNNILFNTFRRQSIFSAAITFIIFFALMLVLYLWQNTVRKNEVSVLSKVEQNLIRFRENNMKVLEVGEGTDEQQKILTTGDKNKMKVSEILKKNEVTISCEIFPPKQGAQLQNYKAIAAEIAKLKPAYISCTYGATGGTSDYTVEIADAINSYGVPAIAHLTCVSSTREKVHTVISELKERGIENILALRGDIPTNTDFPLPDQYHHAIELIREIKEAGDFCIGGACYPEGHPEAANMNEDLDHLKEKVDAGCEYLTTQMFFDNNIYYRFLYKALAKGIDVPVTAGIMPVTNAAQVKRTISLTGNLVPAKFLSIVDRFGDNPAAMKQAGIAYATEQIIDLIANGVNHIHIYSMNKPDVAAAIMNNLSQIYVREQA